jgi:hypothetical protein
MPVYEYEKYIVELPRNIKLELINDLKDFLADEEK